MQTESIARQPRRHDRYTVSRALQEMAPLQCTLQTPHGKAVPLSSAGYVLHYGRSYRLRVRSPLASGDIQEVRLVDVPDFLVVDPSNTEYDAEGNAVYVLAFRVPLRASLHSLRGALMCADNLEVAHLCKPGVAREVPNYEIPIVVRPYLASYLILLLGSLLATWLPNTLMAAPLRPDRAPDEALRDSLQPIARSETWLWIGGVCALVASAIFVGNFIRLCWVNRGLRMEFRERYPAVPTIENLDMDS